MTIEDGMYTELTSDAGVSALVGTRVHPMLRPKGGTLPAITYQRISSIRDNSLDGPMDYVSYRIQIDCWAGTYAQAKALGDAVRAALNGVSTTLGGEAVQFVTLESDNDELENDGDTRHYRVSQDWMITLTEV